MIRPFEHFACIDWSGAQGERLPGIKVAICARGAGSPRLLPSGGGANWSRREVLRWLLDHCALGTNMLVGMDFSAALPFADLGAYFPGLSRSPPDARALWRDVEACCAEEPHLAARGYAEHPERAPFFRIGTATGARFPVPGRNGRLRVAECHPASGRPVSSFNLVGAAQVGLASLAGMRLLARLNGVMPIWPFDPVSGAGPLLVEVYTGIAARAALPARRGTKLRTIAALNEALAAPAIGGAPVRGAGPIDDHGSDALLAAAWLRRAADRQELWHPAGLAAVRETEGWTFGVP